MAMSTVDQTSYPVKASECVHNNLLQQSPRSFSTSDSGSEACDSHSLKPQPPEPSLERTVSQALKRKKVDDSMVTIQGAERSVFELQNQVGSLRKQESNIDGEREVENLLKRARNLGEDLLQETLRLDSLTGLLPEDRAERKRVLNLAEKMLETVDDAKRTLVEKRHALTTKDEAPEATTLDTSLINLAPAHAVCLGDTVQKMPVIASDAPAAEQSASVSMSNDEFPSEGDALKMPTTLEGAQGWHKAVPPPKLDLWERLRLPLELRTQEHDSCYVLLADVPSLVSDSLKLRIKDSGLRIAGLCLPSVKQSAVLQEHVQSHLQNFAPHMIHQSGGMEQAANALYAQGGRGSFGSFVETVRLPCDVEQSGISASCKDGKMQVVIPKLRYAQPGWRSARVPQRNSFHGIPYAARSPFFDW